MRFRPVSSDSLPAVIDAFPDWLKPRRSPDTSEWYRYRLERRARRYPDLPASDLTAEMVEDWVDGYERSGTSRRNDYRSVKRCLRWAIRRRLLKENPVRDLEVPAAQRRETVVTPDEYRQLLSLRACL